MKKKVSMGMELARRREKPGKREQVENIMQSCSVQLSTVHYRRAPRICFLIVSTGSQLRPCGGPSCGQADIPLSVPFPFDFVIALPSSRVPASGLSPMTYTKAGWGWGTPLLLPFVTWGNLSWFNPGGGL